MNSLLLQIIAVMFGALTLGSLIRLIALGGSQSEFAKSRMHSLIVWWLLAIVLATSLLVGELGVAVLLGLAATIGLREYLSLLKTRPHVAVVSGWWMVLAGWIFLGVVCAGQADLGLSLYPIASLILLCLIQLAARNTATFVEDVAAVYLGAMLTFYALAHGLLLFHLPADPALPAGAAGLFLYLILLTESSDIAQALVGRVVGRHKITPHISPHKTWEGLLAGVVVSSLLAIALAPVMTNFMRCEPAWLGWLFAATAGALISLSGFLGDINMSALKREAGVKDSSHLLPGMGGMLDRIDSLIFSAPTFYYFLITAGCF